MSEETTYRAYRRHEDPHVKAFCECEVGRGPKVPATPLKALTITKGLGGKFNFKGAKGDGIKTRSSFFVIRDRQGDGARAIKAGHTPGWNSVLKPNLPFSTRVLVAVGTRAHNRLALVADLGRRYWENVGAMFIQLLIGAIMLGGIMACWAWGTGIIYKTSGLLTFAQGARVLMIGAFLGYTFFKLFHMSVRRRAAGDRGESCSCLVFSSKDHYPHDSGWRPGPPLHVVLATIGIISIALQNLAALIGRAEIQQFPPIFKCRDILNFGCGSNVAPGVHFRHCRCLGRSMVLLHLFMEITPRSAPPCGRLPRIATPQMSADITSPFPRGVELGPLSSALAAISGIIIGPVYGDPTC